MGDSSPDHRRRHLAVDPANVTAAALAPAVAWLMRGGVVLFPTDTFYGLAVNPASAEAVAALFDVKGRDARMAVPLVAESLDALTRVGTVMNDPAARLARAFWPGPLSLIIDAPSFIDPAVHGGLGTIAVRVPDDRVARALAGAHGGLLTATSANLSRRPPARTVGDALDVARDSRVFILDAGSTPGGAPSTIVDVRGDQPKLVREGAVAWERVQHVVRQT